MTADSDLTRRLRHALCCAVLQIVTPLRPKKGVKAAGVSVATDRIPPLPKKRTVQASRAVRCSSRQLLRPLEA